MIVSTANNIRTSNSVSPSQAWPTQRQEVTDKIGKRSSDQATSIASNIIRNSHSPNQTRSIQRQEVTEKITNQIVVISPDVSNRREASSATPARFQPSQMQELKTAQECIQFCKIELDREIIGEGTRAKLQRLDTLVPKLNQAIETYSRLSPNSQELGDAYVLSGKRYEQRNEFNEALKKYEEGVAIYEKLSLDPILYSPIYKKMGRICEVLDKTADALSYCEKARDIYLNHLQTTSLNKEQLKNLAELHGQISVLIADLGATRTEILTSQEASKAIYETHFPNSLALANCYDKIGSLLEVPAESQVYYQKSLSIEESLPQEVQKTYLARIKDVYQIHENVSEVSGGFVKTCQGLANDVFAEFTTYFNMSRSNKMLTKIKSAVKQYEDILAYKRTIRPNSRFISAAFETIGDVYKERNKPKYALKEYMKSRDMLKDVLNQSDPVLVSINQKIDAVRTNTEQSVAATAASISRARDGSTIRAQSVAPATDGLRRLLSEVAGYSSGRFEWSKVQCKEEAKNKLYQLLTGYRDAKDDDKETKHGEIIQYLRQEMRNSRSNPIFAGGGDGNLIHLFMEVGDLFFNNSMG